MGLSYAPEYVYTEHFIQRANERFGVKEEQLPKWISKQINSLTLYDSSEGQNLDKRKYISDSGIILFAIQLNVNLLLVMKRMIWWLKGKRLPYTIITLTYLNKKLRNYQGNII